MIRPTDFIPVLPQGSQEAIKKRTGWADCGGVWIDSRRFLTRFSDWPAS